MRDPHALAAATGGSLDHHRIADLVCDLGGMHRVFDHAEIAGHGRNLGRGCRFLGFDLVAHRFDGAHIRADEGDVRFLQRLGERRALGQKAVARMHRFGAGLFAGFDDFIDDEIGLRRGRRTDVHCLVSHFDVECVLVGVGIDRDGGNAHPLRGLDDPARDLAAIGDQDFLEHARPGLTQPSPVCGAI